MQRAIFGGGCFWCTESVFRALKGVSAVTSGYAGGDGSPRYDAVCSGRTGHAEVVAIDFDPAVMTFDDLLAVFFATHDPTTLNRQGNDVGSQYRSVIFYTDDNQRQQAEQMVTALRQDGIDVVTEISPAPVFHPAEDYHQRYYEKNPTQGYCNFMIPPKLAKLNSRFQHLLASA